MFGNISIQAGHKVVTPRLSVCVYKRPRQYRSLRVSNMLDTLILKESFDASVKATASKIAALYFTYPFETCKVYKQLDKKWESPMQLYQGFHVFLITASLQCFINYNVFFYLVKALGVHYNINKSGSIFYASILSCLLTSFIKVQTTFIAKNVMFIKTNNILQSLKEVMSFMTWQLYSRSWLSNLISDIPDSFVKFGLNSFLIMQFPTIHNLVRSLITGLTASIVNTPLDYWLTLTMCKTASTPGEAQAAHNQNQNQKTHSLAYHSRNCFAGFNYRILATIIGNVMFFSMFNTLHPTGI